MGKKHTRDNVTSVKIRKPSLNGEVRMRKKIVHLRKFHAYLKTKGWMPLRNAIHF